jgi:hypothetical protein
MSFRIVRGLTTIDRVQYWADILGHQLDSRDIEWNSASMASRRHGCQNHVGILLRWEVNLCPVFH